MNYSERLERIKILENTWQNAINQSELYGLIMQHFYSPLPEGRKVKKALVIGYDGCTCEMLNYLDKVDRGAVKYLISNGGHGIFSYAGGAPYPEPIIQETSTAPSWCSMLTSNLAPNSKIYSNGTTKEVEPKSLIIKLVDDKAAKKTAKYLGFTVTGTLGVLLRAKRMGVVQEVRPLLQEIRKNGFYVSATVANMVLTASGEECG